MAEGKLPASPGAPGLFTEEELAQVAFAQEASRASQSPVPPSAAAVEADAAAAAATSPVATSLVATAPTSPGAPEGTPGTTLKRRRLCAKSPGTALPPAVEESAIVPLEVAVDDLEESGPWFCVKQHLHLGLNLKIGNVYSESMLRQRCKGDVKKLAKLDRFFKDKRTLSRVEGAPAVPSSASGRRGGRRRALENGSAAPAETPSTSGRKKARPAAPQQPAFLSGQVVWDTTWTPSRVAKVVEFEGERGELCYRVRFLDEAGAKAGEAGEVYRSEAALKGVEPSDFQAQALAQQASAMPARAPKEDRAVEDAATAWRMRPGPREPPSSVTPGQVVWVKELQRPDWPALVKECEGSRVRLVPLGAEGEEEHPLERLLAFQQGDATSLSWAAERAEALHRRAVEDGAASTAAA